MFALVTLRVLNLLMLQKRMATFVRKVSTALRDRTPLNLVLRVLLVQAQDNRKPLNASSVHLVHMVMKSVLLLANPVVAPHAPKLVQRVASVLG